MAKSYDGEQTKVIIILLGRCLPWLYNYAKYA